MQGRAVHLTYVWKAVSPDVRSMLSQTLTVDRVRI